MKLFALANVSLGVASAAIFKLVSVSQLGPNWEVPDYVMLSGTASLFLASIFVVISWVSYLMSVKCRYHLEKWVRVVYLVWNMIVCSVVLFGVFGNVYKRWSANYPTLRGIIISSFWYGVGISILLTTVLQVGSMRSNRD